MDWALQVFGYLCFALVFAFMFIVHVVLRP